MIWHVYRDDGFVSWHRSLEGAERASAKLAKRTGLMHWVTRVPRCGYTGGAK
jgi:hypothetical protein